MTDPREARALLTDGTVAVIRRLRARDAPAVRGLHENLPERDIYLRFFSPRPTHLEHYLDRMITEDVRHTALGAFVAGELAGMVTYEVVADSAEAEIAFAVSHHVQAHGVGTLLLEHLVSVGKARGVRRFVADVLAENSAMLRVFTDFGLPVVYDRAGTVVHVVLSLDADEQYLDAVTDREGRADVASLVSLLRPGRVAVVGAGRRTGTVGNAVLRRILDGGFTGSVVAVNPHANQIAGTACYPSMLAVPDVPDLAVVCVPASAVPGVAADCAKRGVPAMVVITAGITTDPALRDELMLTLRHAGMRMVGPNCLGVVNTDPLVRLDATFADQPATPGGVGIVTQSGAAGIVLLDQLGRLGLGVSSMVSTGDKYDVSGNDLLRWWERDEQTKIAVLYLESFGNPRKFTRLARRLSHAKPVLALRTGTSEIARRAAASHTAAAASPAVTRDALYRQAGVIAVDTLTELLATVTVLSGQTVPAGTRTMIVSNAGGGGVLAADACAVRGLTLLPPSSVLTAALRSQLPQHASLANPIDTTAGVTASTFGRCVRAAIDDAEVDAVLAITVPTALGDPAAELAEVVLKARAAGRHTPVVTVNLVQTEAVGLLADTVPSFAEPAMAVGALANAMRHGQWLARPKGTVPDLPGVDVQAARAHVERFLAENLDGGWLPPSTVVSLLRCFGLPVLQVMTVFDEDQAVEALRSLGGPVVLKAVVDGVVHKSASGGVALGIIDEETMRSQVRRMRDLFGARLRELVLQPMAARGRELLVGVKGDPTFGPLVVLGMGGTDTDLIADRACTLVPVTDVDATELLHGLRASAALTAQGLDFDGLRDVLLRVGRLAELLPEVAELDLNPVISYREGCVVVDARILVRPGDATDLMLRELRA